MGDVDRCYSKFRPVLIKRPEKVWPKNLVTYRIRGLAPKSAVSYRVPVEVINMAVHLYVEELKRPSSGFGANTLVDLPADAADFAGFESLVSHY